MKYSETELLAPAGSTESLKAAIIGGASAVYLGLKDFSARAKAANFTFEELENCVRYAHLFGVKVFVAVNTLIKDSEIDDAVSLVHSAEKLGVDAFIIQDLGLFQKVRKMTDLPLHASTQLGIHNVYGAKIAKKLGFDRVILSREAGFDDIKRIRDDVDIEIEAFVQGALCVAFSGNCLFSSLVSGYSGNRGKCMQLCRKKYNIRIGNIIKDGYYLSAKDICRLPMLKQLIDAGVCSLKIEGRMRRPEYVGESVYVYKEALKRLDITDSDDYSNYLDRLKRIYNRGDYCNGYLKDKTENVIYPAVQGHKGVRIGTVSKTVGKRAVLNVMHTLRKGDGLKFLNANGESGGCLVDNVSEIYFDGSVKKGDEVYITTDSKQLEEINGRARTVEIDCKVILKKFRSPQVILSSGKAAADCYLDTCVQQAKNAPLTKKYIAELFSKSVSPFLHLRCTEVDMDDDIFLSVGQLKELRRKAEQAIIDNILNQYDSEKRKSAFLYGKNTHILSDIIHRNCDFNCEKLLMFDSTLYVDRFNDTDESDGFIFMPSDYSDFSTLEKVFSKSNKPIFLYTPIMARGKDLEVLERIANMPYIENIVANNLYAIELFKDKNILIGSDMNLLNNLIGLHNIMPLEADRGDTNNYMVEFSRLPLMTFAHCPYKNLKGCCGKNCKGFTGQLTDERDNIFSLSHYKIHSCYSQLWNCKPLCLYEQYKGRFKKLVFDFRGYSPEFAKKYFAMRKVGNIELHEHTKFNFGKSLR